MDHREILKHVDHTLLRTTATWPEIQALCDEGMQYGVAAVCIPPAFVRQAAEYVENRLKICTVISFPNGYSTTEVKVFETEDAVRAGADEIDMVINLGMVKQQDWDGILRELKAVKQSCAGRILKVIVETCELTQEEKIKLCALVSQSGADYIKTSTGFAAAGASQLDVALFKANIAPDVRIKAAGGIRTWEDAQSFLEVGADRLGSSALVALAKAEGL